MKKEVNVIIVCTIVLLLIVSPTLSKAFEIQPKYITVTAQGTPAILTITPSLAALKFKAGRQLSVSSTGKVESITPFDSKNCNSWVVAIDTITGQADTCKVSIVPWTSNLSALTITDVSRGYRIFGKCQDTLFVDYNNNLYKTGDDLNHLIPLSPFPLKDTDYYWAFLKTPAGYFIRNEKDIYYSIDERKWSLDYTTRGRGVRNSFAYTYDSISKTTHVFAHDYSVTGQDTFPHSVYRKTISPIKLNSQWEKVFTFYSKDQWAKDKTLFPACRHIHTINVDPYSGHLWIGTGDFDLHNHIYYSDDNGDHWKHVGMGSQQWRVLSIWFTADFVYWAMDTSSSEQKIFRISRNIYAKKGYWPDMSEKVVSGYPKNNVMYMVLSARDHKFVCNNGSKAEAGDIIWGNQWGVKKASIDENNALMSLNDPDLDYRETVANLANNALWGNIKVFDDKGDIITLVSANAEGGFIDRRPRVFGIKERFDKTVDVQELLSTDMGTSVYSQFYPYEQDAKGNIYFQTAMMNNNVYKWDGIIKTSLNWNDNTKSKGGEVIVETRSRKDVRRQLKLINYDGTILEWQQANSSFDWKKIQVGDSIVNDTISVNGEPGRTKYIRAIVQKENNSAVASKYIKIEFTENDTEEITINNPLQSAVRCFPNPVTSDILNIQLIKDSIGKCNVDIVSILGQTIIHTINDFDLNPNIELYLSDLPLGVFVLKIDNSEGSYVQKIVKK